MFFLIALNFLLWIAAAVVYPIGYHTHQAGEMIVGRALIQNLLIGLGTLAAAFFILEYVQQKLMVPYFFPDGGLYLTPHTLRIRIRTRLAALMFACNLISFLALIAIVRGSYRVQMDVAQLLDLMRPVLLTNAALAMSVAVG